MFLWNLWDWLFKYVLGLSISLLHGVEMNWDELASRVSHAIDLPVHQHTSIDPFQRFECEVHLGIVGQEFVGYLPL